MFDVSSDGYNVRMFWILDFCLFVSNQPDVLITYYSTLQYLDFWHWRLDYNYIIVCIFPLSIAQNNLYIEFLKILSYQFLAPVVMKSSTTLKFHSYTYV